MSPVRRLVGRAATTLAVLLLVSVATFSLVSLLPGDPALAILGPRATPANVAALRADLGLDEPVAQRYLQWAGRAAQGDLGVSYLTDEPVARSLRQRLPASMELLVLAQLATLALAVPLGTLAALRAGGRVDRLIGALSFAGMAVPGFAVGVGLIAVFVVRLHWFDTFGYVPLLEDPAANLRAMVLPALTLALPLVAVSTRVLRNDLVATLQQDHVLAARANGLAMGTIVRRHALRQSVATLLTVVGLNVSGLLGGAVVVETLFAVPGIGRLVFSAIGDRDYLVVQGAVLAIAVTYVAVNTVLELVQWLADPRLRRPGTET